MPDIQKRISECLEDENPKGSENQAAKRDALIQSTDAIQKRESSRNRSGTKRTEVIELGTGRREEGQEMQEKLKRELEGAEGK